MFTVYSTTKGTRVCIHSALVSDPKVKLIDPELELEANSPGSLIFSIPPHHISYNDYKFTELDIARPGTDANASEPVDGVPYTLRGYLDSEDLLYSLPVTEITSDSYSSCVYGGLVTPSASSMRKNDFGKWYFPYVNMEDPEAVQDAWDRIRSSAIILELVDGAWILAGDEFDRLANYKEYRKREPLRRGDVYAILSVPPQSEMTYSGGQWSLTGVDMSDSDAVSARWRELYSSYFTPYAGDWVAATSRFNPENVYRKLSEDDDNYMVFGFSDFEMLDSQNPPDDWGYMYSAKYYYYDETFETYVPIPEADRAPEYEPGKYYIRPWDHAYTNVNIYQEKVTSLNLVERMISKITVYRLETRDNGDRYEKEIWEGRVISEEIDWDGNRKIYCEGIFGYLNDTLQPQKVYGANTTLRGFLWNILTEHNSKVADDHKFTLDAVEDGDLVVGAIKTDYGSTMEVLSQLVSTYGGYFKVLPPIAGYPWHRITYLRAREDDYTDAERKELVDNNRVIRFGKNLLDFTKKWDLSSLVTSIIPCGGTKNEVQETIGAEITAGQTNLSKKVLSSKSAYSYTVLNSSPPDWQTGYYNYYTASNSTTTGYKKVSKSRSGAVPTFTPGTYYAKSKTSGPVVQVCSASSSYRITKRTIWTSGTYKQQKYYVTTTIDAGHYAYAWFYTNQNGSEIILDVNSGKATGIKTYKDQAITSPDPNLIPANATKVGIIICGYGNSAMSFKAPAEDKDEEFDRRYRITDYKTDGEWHTEGSEYISNPALVEKYGYIERQVTFENISKKDETETDSSVVTRLYAEAKKYLTSSQFDKMAIEIEAFDLRALGVKYDGIDIYDILLVVSPPHGLDKIFQVTRITIPLSRPEEQRITLGFETDSTISGVTVSTNSQLRADFAAIPTTSTTLKQAKERAKELIFGDSQRGVVRFEEGNGTSTTRMDTEGTIRAIEIVSTNQASAQNIGKWRWSYGGLGYATSSDGGETWNTPSVAMTNDGQIVADFITTGNLDAALITGGMLTIGGANHPAGKDAVRMRILDSNGNVVATADEGGYRSFGTWTAASGNTKKSKYVKIDDGILTAGEATMAANGTISYTSEYGVIDTNYSYGGRNTVAIQANYSIPGGQQGSGDVVIASNRIGVTRNLMSSGDVVWGHDNRTPYSVISGITYDSTTKTLTLLKRTITITNGIITGFSDGGVETIVLSDNSAT